MENLVKGEYKVNLEKVIKMLLGDEFVKGKINMDIYQEGNCDVEHECKSTGCVIGHSVRLLTKDDFLLLEEQKKSVKSSAYSIFCKEYFGIDFQCDAWYFLFGANWANSALFAAERIEFFLMFDRNIKSIEDMEEGEYLYEAGITSFSFVHYEEKRKTQQIF